MAQHGEKSHGLVAGAMRIGHAALRKPRRPTQVLPLPEASSTPPRALRPNEEYVQIKLVGAHLPHQRVLLTQLTPAVYVGASLVADGQAAGFGRIVGGGTRPAGTREQIEAQATIRGALVVPATPFRGHLEWQAGLVSVRDNAKARKWLEQGLELSEAASAAFVGLTDAPVQMLGMVLEGLLQDGSKVEIGVQENLTTPKTGVYAIFESRDEEDEKINFTLRNGRLYNADTNRPLQRPHLIIEIAGLDRRLDGASIPRLKAAYEELLKAIEDAAPQERINALIGRYIQLVTFVPDLLETDKTAFIEAVKASARTYRASVAEFQSAPEGALESLSAHTPPPARPSLESVYASAVSKRLGEPKTEAHTAAPSLEAALKALRAANKQQDPVAVAEAGAACVNALHSAAQGAEESQLKEVMIGLRQARRYGDLKQAGMVLDKAGVAYPSTQKLHAQALIELGEADKAETQLERAADLAQARDEKVELADIHGLMGRVRKDRFVASEGEPAKVRQPLLDAALDAYRKGARLDKDPGNFYHEVNLMALAHAGKRAGLSARGVDPTAIAHRILRHVHARLPNVQVWDYANAAEAELALARGATRQTIAKAARWLDAYVDAAFTNGFALNSTLRQLKTLWQAPDELINVLQLAAIVAENGSARFDGRYARSLLAADDGQRERFEKAFGNRGWALKDAFRALELAQFVGMVREGRRAHGTGFLLPSARLLPHDWSEAEVNAFRARHSLPEWVFVTNGHVVSTHEDDVAQRALHPDAASVRFELFGDTAHKVKRILWNSPCTAHDCTVLELESLPEIAATVHPIDVARGLPPRHRGLSRNPDSESGEVSRVLVMGHPAGRGIELTFDSNLLIDHNGPTPGRPFSTSPVSVHYQAPTEGGSSGSAVFNARTLELIAIHHMGGVRPFAPPEGAAQEPVAAERYEANQGKAIRPILLNLIAWLEGQGPGGLTTAAVEPAPAAMAPTATALASVPPAVATAGSTGDAESGPAAELGEDAFEAMRGYREFDEATETDFESKGFESVSAPIRSLSEEAANFISGFEISSPAYYRRRLQSPIWPGGASGLTIGVGYDLKHSAHATFRQDWGYHLPWAVTERLAVWCGVGEADQGRRREIVRQLADIVIPLEAAQKVFQEASLPTYAARTLRAFPGSEQLSDRSFGALVSLVFNRGARMSDSDPLLQERREMRAIRDHLKAGRLDLIPEEFRSMKRIWEGKPDVVGLLRRRDEEAALFERGLADPTPTGSV